MRNLIIAIVVIVVLVGGYFLLRGNYKTSNSTSSSSSNSNQTSDACSSAPEAGASVTITYSDSGFSPSLVSIKAGGVLTVKNTSSNIVQFQSNPHPAHTDDTDLNIGTIDAGASKTATLNKTGCFGYHNHLSPDQGGNILIK